MPVGEACVARDPTTEDTKVAMRPTVMVMGPKKAVGMSACTPVALVVNMPTTPRTLLTVTALAASRPCRGTGQAQMVALGDTRVMCHLPRLPQGFLLSRSLGLHHLSSPL